MMAQNAFPLYLRINLFILFIFLTHPLFFTFIQFNLIVIKVTFLVSLFQISQLIAYLMSSSKINPQFAITLLAHNHQICQRSHLNFHLSLLFAMGYLFLILFAYHEIELANYIAFVSFQIIFVLVNDYLSHYLIIFETLKLDFIFATGHYQFLKQVIQMRSLLFFCLKAHLDLQVEPQFLIKLHQQM